MRSPGAAAGRGAESLRSWAPGGRPWPVRPRDHAPDAVRRTRARQGRPAGRDQRESRPRTLLRASAPSRPATASATDAGSWSGATTRLRRASTPAPGPIQAAATAGSWPSAERGPGEAPRRRTPGRSPWAAAARRTPAPPGRRAPARPGRAPGRAPPRPGRRRQARGPSTGTGGPAGPTGPASRRWKHRHRPPAPAVVQQHQGDVGLPCRRPALPGAVRSPAAGRSGQHRAWCRATFVASGGLLATASSAAASAGSAAPVSPANPGRDAAGRPAHGVGTGRTSSGLDDGDDRRRRTGPGGRPPPTRRRPAAGHRRDDSADARLDPPVPARRLPRWWMLREPGPPVGSASGWSCRRC